MNFSESQFDGGSQTSSSPASEISALLDLDWLKSSDQMVLAYLRANFAIEMGIHKYELPKKLNLSFEDIVESIRTLVDEGAIYETYDFHYKALDAIKIYSVKKIKTMNFSEAQFDGGSQTANFPAAMVSVVGIVSRIVERDLDVTTFTLYDGTGELNCKGWLNELYDRLQMEEIEEGVYVHVDGYLKSFKGEKYAAVFSVRRVTNSDESILPFIACVLTSKHQKIQGDSENMNYTPKTPIQNGTNVFMSTQSSQISAPLPLDLDWLKSSDQMVLAYLRANFGIEKGIHKDELPKKLNLPIEDIVESIRTLEDEGAIYETFDFHYKAV